MKALRVPWFDVLAKILSTVEDGGGSLEGLLDACIAMHRKVD